MDDGLAFSFPACLQNVQAQGNTKTQGRLILVKLDVWQRLRGVRYAIFQVDLARSLAAGHSLAISFARTASGSIGGAVGRSLLFVPGRRRPHTQFVGL